MDNTSTLKYLISKYNPEITSELPLYIKNTNRKIMAETLAELDVRVGVEVGVAEAEHAEILCKYNPQLHLYGVDAWAHYSGYADYRRNDLDAFKRNAENRLAPYNCTLIHKFSMDALQDFKDGTLDFVYIDGAHDFKNAAMDIFEWSKKVKPGGIVYGHDFVTTPTCQVEDVVRAYMKAFSIDPWFVLGEFGKSNGLFKEGVQSWLYVKS